jgi:polar amino acid transport system substrate-binding protein/glutamate/aspartate transport system substrate-binding protein
MRRVRAASISWVAALATLAAVQAASGSAAAATLDKIKADQTIRIAYRQDARPFSFMESDRTEPGGFMLDLCRAVAKRIGEQLKLPDLKVAYVPVTAANRFEAIQKKNADLLCEPTSATLSRRKQVDFSIPTFVDGAGLLVRDTTINSLPSLAGRKVGVLAGTTTEKTLRDNLKIQNVNAEVIPAKTHAEGLKLIDDGQIAAYFADRSILMFLLRDSSDPAKLAVADQYLTIEPYALALARGDSEFRLAVDTALSRIYRTGDIVPIFGRTFGNSVKPSQMNAILYVISGLPD